MKDAKYDFAFDPCTGILRVVLSGFLLPEELQTYLAARTEHREKARHSAGRLRMLVDASAAPVQSPHTAEIAESDWRDAIRSPSDKIAIVPSSALHALQVQRTIKSDRVRVFTRASEAEKWLRSD